MPLSATELCEALPGLAAIGDDSLKQLGRACTIRRYAVRDAIYHAGADADGLYLVLSGRVLVVRETSASAEMLHTEAAGGVLGEIPVFGRVPFPATATALEPTRCGRIPVGVIERLLAADPAFARWALMRLAGRGQVLLRRIDDLTATTVVSRLAAYVQDRARETHSADFTLGVSQAQLATELGTAREVVVRGLAALVSAGAISRAGRSRFGIRRAEVLAALAGKS